MSKEVAERVQIHNFAEPQSLEGLKVDIFSSFATDPHDMVAMTRSIASSSRLASEIRDREAKVRATELSMATASANVANAFFITKD